MQLTINRSTRAAGFTMAYLLILEDLGLLHDNDNALPVLIHFLQIAECKSRCHLGCANAGKLQSSCSRGDRSGK